MLKLAGEHNVDLDLVEGTGANGRITRKDILKLVESGNIPQAGAAKKEEAVAAVVESASRSTKSSASSAKSRICETSFCTNNAWRY
ncbi:E3 binding domain-containing protein [Bacillus cereus]